MTIFDFKCYVATMSLSDEDCVTAAISQLKLKQKERYYSIQKVCVCVCVLYAIACFGVISFDRVLQIFFSCFTTCFCSLFSHCILLFLPHRVSWFAIENDLFVAKNGIQYSFDWECQKVGVLYLPYSRVYIFRSYPFDSANKRKKVADIFSSTKIFCKQNAECRQKAIMKCTAMKYEAAVDGVN